MKATVRSVPDGTRLSYYVAYPLPREGLPVTESVTFLARNWQGTEDTLPEPGQIVALSGIVQFAGGWRAKKASPVTLDDESGERKHEEAQEANSPRASG